MDNTKGNRYYLDRILTDLCFIIAHTQDLDQEDLKENEVLQDSVMFRLIQISENSDKLTQNFKDQHPEIAWRALKGMRNRIVHNYGGVDMGIIYDTVTNDIPATLKELQSMLHTCPCHIRHRFQRNTSSRSLPNHWHSYSRFLHLHSQ